MPCYVSENQQRLFQLRVNSLGPLPEEVGPQAATKVLCCFSAWSPLPAATFHKQLPSQVPLRLLENSESGPLFGSGAKFVTEVGENEWLRSRVVEPHRQCRALVRLPLQRTCGRGRAGRWGSLRPSRELGGPAAGAHNPLLSRPGLGSEPQPAPGPGSKKNPWMRTPKFRNSN